MLSKLKRLVKRYGIAEITRDLGYRSTTTIRNWINAGRIPATAKEKVKIYLEGK